jgi:hypothetical protein
MQQKATACSSHYCQQQQKLQRSRSKSSSCSSSWTQHWQQLQFKRQGKGRTGVLWLMMLQKHPSMTPQQQQQVE